MNTNDALLYALDHAEGELREAKNLYGHYPESGLGRKVTRAQSDVDMVRAALAAFPTAAAREAEPAAPVDALLYLAVTDAMGYEAGAAMLSPEEWAADLLRDAQTYRALAAAPVDARDAQLLKGLRSYLERDRRERFAAADKRADAAQHFILDIDAAIARQAAASAEGES